MKEWAGKERECEGKRIDDGKKKERRKEMGNLCLEYEWREHQRKNDREGRRDREGSTVRR